ncbi:NAD(P)H-dependent oxidoreductase [Candidatus Woesearchaeota archaeon]|nr:NAD(P)H-dependent oxidoreductase [Candidatus Woesearchaeota archaeon]
MEFKEIVEKRYAVKKFDKKVIPENKIEELLEIIRLSASSFGLQPYKIKIVDDQETKEKLLPASWNQPQINTCSHLMVFCANINVKEQIEKYEEMMESAGIPLENIKAYTGVMKGFEEGLSDDKKLSWATKQTYLAVGNAINGATSLGFDSCPMEGFSPEEYSKILDLPENTHPVTVVTLGYAADEPRPKIRYSKKDLFF